MAPNPAKRATAKTAAAKQATAKRAGSKSAANPAHPAAAASMDPEPGPAYIRPELTSGGNAP